MRHAPSAPPGSGGALSAMVVATLLWGATFVVVRDSVEHIDPAALVFSRFLMGALLLAPVAALRRTRLTREALAGGALAGVFMACGYLFQAIGLTTTSAGTSAFLTASGQLFAGFFAWPIFKQRPGGVLIAGIAVALAGSALMGSGRAWGFGAGEWWTLLGSLSFGLQIIAVARFAPRVDPVLLTVLQSLAVAVVLAPFAGTTLAQLASLDATGWWRLGYLVVAGSVLAPLLQVLAQRVLQAGRIGLLFTLEPVFALFFALTLGGERFVTTWWLGAALILCAVLGVELHAARKPQGTFHPASG